MKIKKIENIEIGAMVAEGKCIVRYEDKVIFVEGAVPGDVVDLQITKNKKTYFEAIPIFFHSYSSKRITPFCSHFGVCGGCKWQHLVYSSQLEYKKQQVVDNLERIGKIALPEISPILGSEYTIEYRNKLEYTFSNYRWLTSDEIQQEKSIENRNALGFHIPKRFDKILDIQTCYLQKEPSNSIRLFVKQKAEELNIPFFDIKKQYGVLRNLLIRTSNTNGLMVILQLFEEHSQRENLLNQLIHQFPEISSLYYIINPKKNETFHDIDVHLYHGSPYLIEQMDQIQFQVGPKSFFQTNSDQAYELYKLVKKVANVTKEDIVYDLYTGTGTIALFLADQAKKVVGLEYIEMAVEDAKLNALANNITNAFFFAGDIKDLLKEDFLQQNGIPGIIIVDPPRSGMHGDVVQMLLQIQSPRIVYVSCNPATQARDVAILNEKYKVKIVQPVDMFPHTYHVENILLLELK